MWCILREFGRLHGRQEARIIGRQAFVSKATMANNTAVVEIDAVTVRTPERKQLIRDIQWRVLPGERWVVLGPNGAGKTTLLSVVGADRHPSEGRATVLGETFGRTDMRELRSRIGRVDPASRLRNSRMSVRPNVSPS